MSLSPEKVCNVLFNKYSLQPNDSPTYSSDSRGGLKGPKGDKDIIKLIDECDDLINGLDEDLAQSRSRLMGSKRKKRPTYDKEVRELIRDGDEFITGIESDLALTRRELKGSKCNKSKRSKYIKEVR